MLLLLQNQCRYLGETTLSSVMAYERKVRKLRRMIWILTAVIDHRGYRKYGLISAVHFAHLCSA
jgi:hypothetical protein